MVLITYMMYCYAYQDLPVIDAFDTNNHFPTCAKSANNPGGKCVTASEALTLITALKSLVPRLHKEAAGAICQTAEKSEDDEENGVVSFVELGHLLLLRGDTDYVQTVTNMQSLVRLNPHWGISLTKHGMSLEDPPLPMLCYFRTTLWSMLWCLLLGILELGIVAGTGSLLYGFWRRQQQRVQVDALDPLVSRRQGEWQGNPGVTQKASLSCLKISNMFDEKSSMGEDKDEESWTQHIRNSILEKCGESVKFVHLCVDRTKGCIYAKCDTPNDARRAYNTLHRACYDGNQVHVKYLHLNRYHERFPEAADMGKKLVPSNPMKLSLQQDV